MRGSPLTRTLILLIGLVVAAVGTRALTAPKAPVSSPSKITAPTDRELTETRFELTLSAPAKEVILESAGKTVSPEIIGLILTGSLPTEGGHPTIFLTIRWAESDDTPRFAKLRLEPPGLPTLTQTFDAIGDLDDVWEPHLHVSTDH
ncbi:hypothetical protein [Haloferula sargassicola]|uniref:Uncharacterized protein n=1 Tax=Haloferula sargassicola TaxID=490096 RepID=A0ABP9UP31_9BACT